MSQRGYFKKSLEQTIAATDSLATGEAFLKDDGRFRASIQEEDDAPSPIRGSPKRLKSANFNVRRVKRDHKCIKTVSGGDEIEASLK